MAFIQTPRQPLIGTLLTTAVQFWLRSQVDKIDHLDFKIEGSNRSLLSGYIPRVSVSAENAVYQGLHLTQVQLQGSEIRFNLGQVLKGQPLHLLESFFVTGSLHLNESALNLSLQASMLKDALNNFVLSLLSSMTEVSLNTASDTQLESSNSWVNSIEQIQDSKIILETDHLILKAKLLLATGELLSFRLKTGLALASSHELLFVEPKLETPMLNTELHFNDYILDLGTDIKIQDLILSPEGVEINATLKVNP